jgi:GTP cyclohydrolase I
MWRDEFFSCVDCDYTDFHLSPNDRKYNEIIGFHEIEYTSVCAHHFLPFTGTAHILYIPDDTFIGASKPSRIVEHYSKRPQLQESLCQDIIDSFVGGVQPLGAMVVLFGVHDCMRCRGVEQKRAVMTTAAVEGVFMEEKDKEDKGYKLIELARR